MRRGIMGTVSVDHAASGVAQILKPLDMVFNPSQREIKTLSEVCRHGAGVVVKMRDTV